MSAPGRVRISRAVTLGDIASFASPRCKLCRGDGQVVVYAAGAEKGDLKLCGCARRSFLATVERERTVKAKADGFRYWFAGCEPESWGLRVAFLASTHHERDLADFRARACRAAAGGGR